MTPRRDLESAIQALWRGVDTWSRLYGEPAFVSLREACERHYPQAGGPQLLNFALGVAVGSMGFRSRDMEGDAPHRDAPALAAERLDEAFRQTTARRTHLAPLDYAGDLPTMRFGNARVQRFTAAELDGLVRAHAPLRNAPKSKFDAHRFSQFSWLVVEETIALADQPGPRTLPQLFINWRTDLGRIEPHKRQFPVGVEDALFALMTLPWEMVTETREADWRPFSVPWVITLDDDLFVSPPSIPAPDTLSWGFRAVTDWEGETTDIPEPLTTPIEDGQAAVVTLDEACWRTIQRARDNPIFQSPIAHFIVRGLLADGIDEFLAHVMSLEASYGSQRDHKHRRKLADGSNPGPNQRVGVRLANLFGDPFALWTYMDLFEVRNAYVHGREMSDIPGPARLEARMLARAALRLLIDLASDDDGPRDRELFLASLLRPPTAPVTGHDES